nr:glycosyltransferase [uncultured Carboxylicivirga sp.]
MIINNGIHPPTTEIYRTLGNTPIIGAIGRLEPEKGFDLLIEAAKILKSKGVNFEVRIAGIGSQQLILQELINTNQLQDQVKLVGFKQDIYQFLSDCHIFALSSRYEGFGYVTVEAMFAKLPVVAFKNSAALEIVEDKETGLLVDKFDTTKFAEAIANILNNSQLIELFGEKGYKRAINNYHFSISVKKLSQIFLK